MEYIKLIIGAGLITGLGWIFIKNWKRKGFINALFRIDMIIGIIAGIYLVITAVNTLISP